MSARSAAASGHQLAHCAVAWLHGWRTPAHPPRPTRPCRTRPAGNEAAKREGVPAFLHSLRAFTHQLIRDVDAASPATWAQLLACAAAGLADLGVQEDDTRGAGVHTSCSSPQQVGGLGGRARVCLVGRASACAALDSRRPTLQPES